MYAQDFGSTNLMAMAGRRQFEHDKEYQYYQQSSGSHNPAHPSTTKQKWRRMMIQVMPFFTWCQ